MPKKYDAGTQERALRMFDEQSGEYASVTAACAAVAERLGLPKDTVRVRVRKRAEQGVAGGLSASEREEVKALRAKVRRLEEDNAVLRSAALFFAGGTRPPQPMIMDFIRSQEAAGRSVESVCRVLREQGLQVAARTYRASKTGYAGLSAGLLAMAYLTNAIHSLAYRFDTATGAGLPAGAGGTVRAAEDDRPAGACGATGRPGRGHPVRSFDRVRRAMSLLRHNGIRRARRKRQRFDPGDGRRAGDLLGRDFTAPAPDIKWVTDFTYVHTYAGWVYVAFVIDCFSHRIVSWSAATSKSTDLVMDVVRMATTTRAREGHPVHRGQLIHHSDYAEVFVKPGFWGVAC